MVGIMLQAECIAKHSHHFTNFVNTDRQGVKVHCGFGVIELERLGLRAGLLEEPVQLWIQE